MTEPCDWNYTDDCYCEHSQPPCTACEEADRVEYMVLVTAARDVGDRIGAPGGSSWEVPPEAEQPAYCMFHVDADANPQTLLEADGFDPTENG